MDGTNENPTAINSVFEVALADYLKRLDNGEAVDRDLFVAEHTDVEAELRSYFATADMLERVREPATDSDTASKISIDTKSGTGLQDTLPPDIEVSASAEKSAEVSGSVCRQFGRYRIAHVLGQGAMGIVYLAHDTVLDRQVALKIPKFTRSAGPKMIERFYREARSAAALHHRNICPLLDLGEIDGMHYITMTYVDGRPLSDFVAPDKPLPLRQVAGTVRKLANALALAHERGVIHRDLKPANILIDRSKEPVIMDFGLARQINKPSDARITRSGALIGTPAYMSPEQVEGQLDAIGPTTDVYSLGVILYELLTGQLPFQGSIAAVIGQIIAVEPKKPSTLRADVDPHLEAICLKMIAKKITDRYASMQDVAEALTAYLKDPNRGATLRQLDSGSLEPPHLEVVALDSEPVPRPRASAKITSKLVRKRDAKGAARRQRVQRRVWISAAAVLLAVGLIYAVVTLFIRFGNVDLKVEIDDPSLAVKFNGQTVTFEGSGQPIRLKPGDHKFFVERDGLEVETDNFTVKKDGKNILRVSLVKGKVVVLKDGQAPPQQRVAPIAKQDEKKLDVETVPPADPIHPDSPAAVEALIIQLGGEIQRDKDNPTGPVTTVDIRNHKFTDEQLDKVKAFPKLRRLVIPSTAITDAGLAHVRGLTELRQIDIAFTGIGDAGLEHLRGMTWLTELNCFQTRVTDKGMESVKTLTGMGFLAIGGTGVTNDGLKHLSGLKNLFMLHIQNPGITDDGLEHLKGLSSLRQLWLQGAGVTDAGINRLKESLPHVAILR